MALPRRMTKVGVVLSQVASLWLPLLMAQAAAWAASVQVTAIEVPFSTRMGGEATGVKRLFRSGCYDVVSESGGGGQKRRERQAGCHLSAEVADAFQRLDVLASASGGGLVKEGHAASAEARHAEAGSAGQLRPILVHADGSRWTPVNDDVAGALLAAINGLPSENQWHARPPAKADGKGPQLVAVSMSTSSGVDARKLQASLSIDGRWWCSQSVAAAASDSAPSRQQKLNPVNPREAAARLTRILQGARPKGGLDDDDPSAPNASGGETSIEVVFPTRPRAALFPSRLNPTVAKRFASEMTRQSGVCKLP